MPEGSKDDLEGEVQAEASKEVTRYYARWNPRLHNGWITVYHAGGNKRFAITNPGEFQIVVDLLRNEKPIYYSDVNDQIRTTSSEPVGEGE